MITRLEELYQVNLEQGSCLLAELFFLGTVYKVPTKKISEIENISGTQIDLMLKIFKGKKFTDCVTTICKSNISVASKKFAAWRDTEKTSDIDWASLRCVEFLFYRSRVFQVTYKDTKKGLRIYLMDIVTGIKRIIDEETLNDVMQDVVYNLADIRKLKHEYLKANEHLVQYKKVPKVLVRKVKAKKVVTTKAGAKVAVKVKA